MEIRTLTARMHGWQICTLGTAIALIGCGGPAVSGTWVAKDDHGQSVDARFVFTQKGDGVGGTWRARFKAPSWAARSGEVFELSGNMHGIQSVERHWYGAVRRSYLTLILDVTQPSWNAGCVIAVTQANLIDEGKGMQFPHRGMTAKCPQGDGTGGYWSLVRQ